MIVKAAVIIDKRREQAVKYKKILDNIGVTVFLASDFTRALELINRFEPDLVLISDSMEFDIKKAIEQLRILTYNTRPCIIALSKSSRIQDKIDVLDAGADDFLPEPMNRDEFKARITAHIRRNFESSLNEKTMLFDEKITYKMLKRAVNSGKNRAFMLISIQKLEYYKEIYGEFAADKILQTCSAVIKSALGAEDYTGHLQKDNFIVITDNEKAERIAAYIVYTFDAAVSKFYNKSDNERGYIFLHGDDEAENKTGFVCLSIGVITNQYIKYTDVKQVISSLTAVHKLAGYKKCSNYVIERLKITADDSVREHEPNNNILIAEPDDALSLLLEASMRLQGFTAKTVNTFDEVFNALENYTPAVIILDAGNSETFDGLDICRKLKSEIKNFKSNIILTAAVHDKEAALNAGADLYLPKPYELSSVSGWVKKFIDDYNS